MELKRIIARDSRAANEKAIQLYGEDVLVISSQRVDNQTELIVAVDTAQDLAAAQPPEQAPARTPSEQDSRRFEAFSDVFRVNIGQPPLNTPEASSTDDQADSAGGIEPAEVLEACVAKPVAQTAAVDGEDWEPAARRLARPAAEPEPTPVLAPALPAAEAPAFLASDATLQNLADMQRSRDTVELLRQEIAALRQEFHLNRQVALWQSGQGLSPELTQWFAQMQELGVPASLRTLMVDATGDHSTVSEAWPHIHQTLTTAIQRRKGAWPQQGVHALVGPSGAGKSLMVARMAMAAAAQLPVESLAIISLADTRPGAWSQLQVLAAQSGVACYRAADLAGLDVLLQDMSHLRAIWIDTPGTDFMAHARSLHGTLPAVTLHAVLPLDATVTNVHKIFESKDLNWSSVMLTKLDEAAHPWPVLKALCDRPLAVSALAHSHLARIEPQAFDARALVDLAMEGLRPAGALPLSAPVKPRRRTPASRTAASGAPASTGAAAPTARARTSTPKARTARSAADKTKALHG